MFEMTDPRSFVDQIRNEVREILEVGIQSPEEHRTLLSKLDMALAISNDPEIRELINDIHTRYGEEP